MPSFPASACTRRLYNQGYDDQTSRAPRTFRDEYRLFQLPKWAKDTWECRTRLERGDYDWAHLACTIWPDRVREQYRADKSPAIARGLEELHVESPAPPLLPRGRAALVVHEEEPDEDGA